jgi:hypothetical protein
METDYKENILPRLEQSDIYKKLVEKCRERDPEVISLIHEAVEYANNRTKTIIRHMGEFTLHDSDHLFRVLHIMERLIGKDSIDYFSIPELQLLILSAFFHDIGMAPDESDVLTWEKIWDSTPSLSDHAEIKKYSEFQQYCFSNPEHILKINLALQNQNYSLVKNIKANLLTEYIRRSHAKRAKEIIDKDWKGKIKFRNFELSRELAQICYSHNYDAKKLVELEKDLLCGSGIYVCVPLIGIILRLADILDFDGKRTPDILFKHLFIRNPISMMEWQKHRSVDAWEISGNKIQFSAKCSHPAIEASILSFSDIIDNELSTCNNLIPELNLNSRNINFKIPYKINREKISAQKDFDGNPLYIFRNTTFELSKRQVVELLMGTKLYGNTEVALRELIQNSIDACLLRQAQEHKWGNYYVPKIEISFYNKDGEEYLEVSDNGTGMDQEIIDKYYSKVGSSFYKSSDFYRLKSESNTEFNPTSRFGIGILSCFMISDNLEVDTRRVKGSHTYAEPLNLRIEGQDSIFYITKSVKTEPGTLTKLTLRKNQNPWGGYNDSQFIEYVENLIPKPPFSIVIRRNHTIKNINQDNFLSKNLDVLKDHSWNNLDNIKVFEFEFDENGLKGKARIGILEKGGNPVYEVYSEAKSVDIQGSIFPLNRKIYVSQGFLTQEASIITVDDSGRIHTSNSTSHLLKSKCKMSFHGIEVPHNLTVEPWALKPNMANIQWPIQFLMLLDISGTYDLDLNSSRSEVLNTEKWNKVEEDLAYIFAKNIKIRVDDNNWVNLKKIYTSLPISQSFRNGFNKL